MILFYLNLCYNEVSYKGSGRANPGSQFVVANTLAIDIDIEILHCVDYSTTCNISPVGLLLR